MRLKIRWRKTFMVSTVDDPQAFLDRRPSRPTLLAD